MFLGFLVGTIALIFFVLLHLFAAAIFGSGIVILVALWLRRRSEFWFLLLGIALFCGGAGALGVAYGAYFIALHLWPDSIWPFVNWIFGYSLGGISGVLVASFFVALRRRSELPQIEAAFKNRLQSTKNEVRNFGFRQTLQLGAYRFRCALWKRNKAI